MHDEINTILTVPLNQDEIIKKLSFIKKKLSKRKNKKPVIKIAILGGSTTQHIKDLVDIFLLKENIITELYEGQFSSFYEEILYDINNLSKFKPDIIWVHTSWRNIKNFPIMSNTESEIDNLLQKEFNFFQEIWLAANKKFSCLFIQNNFDFPNFRTLSNKDSIDSHGKVNYLLRLNSKFLEFSKENKWLNIFDINYISSQQGLNDWQNDRDWHQFRYSPSLRSSVNLSYNFSKIIISKLGLSKKCIIIDLDDTLWGGTIGDDGLEDIKLGTDTAIGDAFLDFQKYILELKERGILLAVISKNEEEVARLGFDHENTILKIDDFSVFVANWEKKYENLKLILDKINIDQNAAIFVDNNPVERDEMYNNSNIEIPNVGEDITQYRKIIDQSNFFELDNLTKEDLKRADAIKSSILSKESSSNFKSHHEYLVSLEMKAAINKLDKSSIERVVQLINKTNQFNTTQEKTNLSFMKDKMIDDRDIILHGSLSDKFSNHGIVSVIYGQKISRQEVNINIWVMSCRVFNRGLEYLIFTKFIDHCKQHGFTKISALYRKTDRNVNYINLYKNLGFNIIEKGIDEVLWELDLKKEIKFNKHAIKLTNEQE